MVFGKERYQGEERMKGRYVISITSRRAGYRLELECKISVLKGNSGTGKIFSSIHDTVLFIDEDVHYLYSESFQRELWRADCYAVIVSRSGMLTGLPYSVFGIYELITEKKGYNMATTMYRYYEKEYGSRTFGLVLTEDSNAGFEMAKYAFGSNDTEVLSADGNSSVLETLIKSNRSYEGTCVNVDGAAFGAFIEPVLKYAEMKGKIFVSVPESFEYIVLNFGDVKKYLSSDNGEILRTYDYCESTEYSTWERYYEDLLKRVTSEHFGFIYSKRKLNSWFKNARYAEQFIDLVCRCFVRRRG